MTTIRLEDALGGLITFAELPPREAMPDELTAGELPRVVEWAHGTYLLESGKFAQTGGHATYRLVAVVPLTGDKRLSPEIDP